MYNNWYVIQVRTRKEEAIVEACNRLVSKKVLKESFIPKYKKMRKYRGKWHPEEDILFKGYVFLISDNVRLLFEELKSIPDLTKMLGAEAEYICPLREEEVKFLLTFSNKYMVDLSEGYIEGDKIAITSGPLLGHEGMIKKIDRHKRIAYLNVELFDQVVSTKVGLEILSKGI